MLMNSRGYQAKGATIKNPEGIFCSNLARRGTLFYGLRTDSVQVMLEITLLAYGCPLPAIVKAFGSDERTV